MLELSLNQVLKTKKPGRPKKKTGECPWFSNLTSLIFSIFFGVGLLIASKIGTGIKEIIGVFTFEMATLMYVLVRRFDKGVS